MKTIIVLLPISKSTYTKLFTASTGVEDFFAIDKLISALALTAPFSNLRKQGGFIGRY